jgi:signal transduction histidine kinase
VLHTDLPAGDRPVFGDRIQLQQVVLNLIMNAIQAMGAVTDRRRELTVSLASAESASTAIPPRRAACIYRMIGYILAGRLIWCRRWSAAILMRS